MDALHWKAFHFSITFLHFKFNHTWLNKQKIGLFCKIQNVTVLLFNHDLNDLNSCSESFMVSNKFKKYSYGFLHVGRGVGHVTPTYCSS